MGVGPTAYIKLLCVSVMKVEVACMIFTHGRMQVVDNAVNARCVAGSPKFTADTAQRMLRRNDTSVAAIAVLCHSG